MYPDEEQNSKYLSEVESKLTPLGFRKEGVYFFHDDLPNGIDMSAYDPDKILNIIYQLGRANGRQEKVEEIRNVLGIVEGGCKCE